MNEPQEHGPDIEDGAHSESMPLPAEPSQEESLLSDTEASPAAEVDTYSGEYAGDSPMPLSEDTGPCAVDETPVEPPIITEPGKGSEGAASVFQSLAVTIVIAVFVITFIVQAFQIPSESMEDTLLIGDYLLVDKAHFGPSGVWTHLMPYSKVHRGDIIVFRFPIHPSQHFVKRVIGVPGDRVKLVKKQLFVNGNAVPESYVVYKRHDRDSFRDNFPIGGSLSPSIEAGWYLELRRLTENGQLIVPAGCYFVLGDNREESLDSRYWGFVPEENVIGRPLVIYWSVRRRASEDDVLEERQNGKLARFMTAVANVFHNTRWNRTLRLVR